MTFDFDKQSLPESPDGVTTTRAGNIHYWSKGAAAGFEERQILHEIIETGPSRDESFRFSMGRSAKAVQKEKGGNRRS